MTTKVDRPSRLLVITGPTATGKTRMAVAIARALGSEIVSADSRQVYRGLDLGTGKDLEEYSEVQPPIRYHMIDIIEPEEVYTLYRFQQDCYRLIREKREVEPFRSGTPLAMAGGTPLYVTAVLLNYRIPNVPNDLKKRDRWEMLPLDELIERLREKSPDLLARTDLSTRRRVARALEIAEYEHDHPVTHAETLEFPLDSLVFAIRIDRKELYRRIDDRLDARLEQGLVAEVRGLLEGGLTHERLAHLGLEYRGVGAYLAGDKPYEDMVRELKFAIHQFARRQDVWFRGFEKRGIPVRWVEVGETESVLEQVYARWPDLRP